MSAPSTGPAPSMRVIGPGRAGRSLAGAAAARGWTVAGMLGRADDPTSAADGVDLVVIATPDHAVAEVAGSLVPVPGTVVAHLSGSLGLDALAPHPRRAGVHPLVALPTAELGATRLLAGAWFGVAGDPLGARLVADLGGRAVVVGDDRRALYHAAACIASNHLVGLLAQVEVLAELVGVPREAYLDLVEATVANVGALGAAGALTGPVARGDWDTVERHRAALGVEAPGELAAYDALVARLDRLARPEAGTQ